MREIRVYGPLATFLKRRVFRAEVGSVAEAVRFLLANFPTVEKFMADQHFRVSLGDRDLDVEELHEPAGQQVIKIIPVVQGAGGGAGKILLGVGLIAAAIVLAPVGGGFLGAGMGLAHAAGGAVATGFISAGVSSAIGMIGVSLALGGVAQLLTPTASSSASTGTDSSTDPRRSYSFSGIQQSSRQGTPIPICYGEIITGSVVISAGIDVDQVAA